MDLLFVIYNCYMAERGTEDGLRMLWRGFFIDLSSHFNTIQLHLMVLTIWHFNSLRRMEMTLKIKMLKEFWLWKCKRYYHSSIFRSVSAILSLQPTCPFWSQLVFLLHKCFAKKNNLKKEWEQKQLAAWSSNKQAGSFVQMWSDLCTGKALKRSSVNILWPAMTGG